MKNAIKLLVLAGALLSVGALAQAGSATNFTFSFPAYAFVFTNVETVTFDFSASATLGTSQLENVDSYYKASPTGLEACLNALLEGDTNGTLDGTGTYTIQSPSTTSNTCSFAPTSIGKYTGAFNVTWGGNGNPDGELLVITNAGSYTVTATFTDDDSDWPSGLNIDIIAGVVNSGSLSSTSSISLGSTASATFNQNDDYTTQFANAYIIPQLYALQLDVMSASINTYDSSNNLITVDATVTYTVAAP
ncbi:hypothetical protein [Oceanithermus sp.]|uniref:hypothetical protein n=1 Tax=Oceanithermus sp. TaxID=2268145 RepID=UPI0025806D3D|nr:hypothetical protein [Oceanithermus sp.]